jgi:hypothetical protein
MQKEKFGIMCPNALFMKTTPCPPEHEKLFVDDSCPGHTEMHYVTSRSHQMQKHKFGITRPDVVFVKCVLGPPEHEK